MTLRRPFPMFACAVALAALPLPAAAECGPDNDFGAYIRSIESGPMGGRATNPGSTATGYYQFTIGTLQSLGYVQSWTGPVSNLFGNSSWDTVVWTGRDGINSREDFMNNGAAQSRAFAELTQRNLQAVSGSWTPGQVVNGVALTEGGVAAATHMLGAGGFRQWAASGFSPSGLSASIAAAHNWTPEQYNNHLMNRVARGGCLDPNTITSAPGSDPITQLPEIFLMPFVARPGAPVILPGQLASVL